MKAVDREYKNNIEGFENKLLLNTSIFISIASMIFSIANIIMGFEVNIIYLTLTAVLVYLSLFIIGFYYKKLQFVRWSMPIISAVFINLVWYLNYVSKGPVLILFVLYYCFLILIGSKRQIMVFTVIIVINLIILFIVEYKFYDLFPNYETERARIVDVYIVTFISLAIALSFINYAKNNYIKQYILAKKADELKSSFLANMSHEIRTPLNAIVGFSSLLANRNYDLEKREKYRRYISSNSEYLLHLVNDILDISKIESNQLDLVAEEFNVNALFDQLEEEYLRMLQNLEKEKSVQLKYVVNNEKLTLNTDRFRFEQIIRNFLSNAIKFTDNGHIKFGTIKGASKYIFYVEDSGCGISQDEIEQIFSRFTKLNNNNETLHRGAGLGLFLSKQLASLLGGEIWAESEENKGSTFYLSLPAQSSNTAEEKS